jgi:hypothetical protein
MWRFGAAVVELLFAEAFCFAQRARCAAAIFLRAEADSLLRGFV